MVRLADRTVRVDEGALRGAADVAAGTYTLRGRGGAGYAIAHPAAVSLPRVLELAGVAPEALSFVSLRRPDGTLIVLRAADLARPGPFPEGPPLVWLDAGSVRFLRPVRDDADVNAADNLATAGGDLAIRVRQGALLGVTLRVAPERPRAGERARLETRVTGAGGAAVAIRWRFGDGTGATGPAVSHRWREEGVYAVVASAAGDDDSGGASVPLLVRVGAPREDPGTAGGGAGDRDAPATGPSNGDAPASGAAPGASESPGSPGSSGSSDSSDAGDSTAPSGTRGTDARSARDRGGPAIKRRLRANPRRDSAFGTVPVRGILVAASVPASAAAAPATALLAARRGAAPGRRDVTLAVCAAIACGLLALGAWRELRPGHP